jgi:hypothetical protein
MLPDSSPHDCSSGSAQNQPVDYVGFLPTCEPVGSGHDNVLAWGRLDTNRRLFRAAASRGQMVGMHAAVSGRKIQRKETEFQTADFPPLLFRR